MSNGINLNPLFNFFLNMSDKADDLTEDEKKELKKLGIVSDADLKSYKELMAGVKAEGASERELVLGTIQPILDSMLAKASSGNEGVVGKILINALKEANGDADIEKLVSALNTQAATLEPKELTDDEKKAKVEALVKQFATGNMTLFEAEKALADIGITCYFVDLPETKERCIEFEFGDRVYTVICNAAAVNDGFGGVVTEAFDDQKVYELYEKYGSKVSNYIICLAYNKSLDYETNGNGQIQAMYYTLNTENWPDGVAKTLAALETWLAQPEESEEEKAIKELIDKYAKEDFVDANVIEDLVTLLKTANIQYNVTKTPVMNREITTLSFKLNDKSYEFYTTQEVNLDSKPDDTTNDDDGVTDNDTTTGGVTNGAGNTNNDTTTGGATNGADGSDDNGKVDNTTGSGSVNNATTETAATGYSLNTLKAQYNFADMDISRYFKKTTDENGNEKYALNEAGIKAAFGTEAKSAEELISFMSGNFNYEAVLKQFKVQSNDKFKSYLVISGDKAKLDFAKIKKDFPNQNIKTFGQLLNAINTPKNETTGSTGSTGTNGSTGATGATVTTYTQAQLAGLDSNAISTYFTKQANGTYVMNAEKIVADFPASTYGTIDTLEKLKTAIEKKNNAEKVNNENSVVKYGSKDLEKYNFADMDISRYFSKSTDENGDDIYTLNQAGIKTAFGTEAKSADELISFMSGNFNYEAVLKQFKVQSNDKFKSYLVISGDKAKLDFAKIKKDFPNQNIKTFGQLLNAINAPKKETTDTTGTTGGATNGANASNGTRSDDSVVTKYTQAQLAGLDSNAISTYFTKQADGTYVMNADKIAEDFPEKDYGKIDTPEKLKTAIANKANADNTSSVAGAGGAGGATNGANASNGTTGATGATEKTGDFASYAEVRSYLFSGAREAVRAAGITNFPNGVVYENIAETVAHAHEKDFASVTKKQLIEEFKAEYNRLIGGTQGTAGTEGTATEWTKEYLQNTYHLTDSDIGHFFDKNGDKYTIRQSATKSCFGKEINNIPDLLKAMQNDGIAIGYIHGAYSMGSDKYLQYFTETIKNGEKRYIMNMTKIKQDFPNQNITTIGQLRDAVDAKGTNASNGTRGDGSDVTKYTQAQLAGLDSNAISTYFTKQADGTYVMNAEKIVADFPAATYGTIDTLEKLKTAIANKANADKTAEANTQIKNNATAVLSLLNKNDSEAIKGNRISSTIILLEQGYASNHNQSTKVNTAYSLIYTDSIIFTDSYVTKMFNELFNHIKTVVGTDNFDEKTLKQLYQTAWQMSYYSYPSSQKNDISDFLTQVYNKFKAIFIRLQNKPEYLDIFTGKTTNSTGSVVDTRAVNAAYQSTGGGWVTCDSTAQTYNDGSIHVSDDQSDANLQKAIKTLREKLQKAYPNIPEAKLNTLINDAVKKAVENIGKQNKTEIPNHFSITSTQTYATTIANLATYYFEQALYITALTDNTFTNGNPKTETKTINVDETTKAKYKAAATSINGMLTDIYDSSHIKGLLANAGIDGDYLLEMDVDSYGNMRFTNLGTKTAYEKLLSEMKTKSGFKNSGLTESEFKQIYNAAWLDSYNSFNNSQKYNLNDVLNKVVANMQKIMNKLSTNPEYLNLIKGGSSMTKITTSTTSVNYGGTDRTRDYGDGNVHLSDDNSDKTYQKYIEELRTKLKDSYVPPLSEYQFNTWFTQAQKDAIYECQENKNDITKDLVYGSLSNMSGAGGTRKGDHSNIEINKLMELIAYKFDKIMYKNVFGAA